MCKSTDVFFFTTLLVSLSLSLSLSLGDGRSLFKSRRKTPFGEIFPTIFEKSPVSWKAVPHNRLVLVGFSMGGITAATLATDATVVQDLVAEGPGTRRFILERKKRCLETRSESPRDRRTRVFAKRAKLGRWSARELARSRVATPNQRPWENSLETER